MEKRWNIFARELEDILTDHGEKFYTLDTRAGVHREKVRRLKQSLTRPISFPVLNPDELSQVIETFMLTEEEVIRLKAAILATAIEETLIDRIEPNSALLAAEELFPVLVRRVSKSVDSLEGLGVLK